MKEGCLKTPQDTTALSNATEDVMRKTKNINMTERTTPEISTKGGMQVKSVSQPSSRGLKIKSVKRS